MWNSLFVCCHPSHLYLPHYKSPTALICIILPVKSAPFFILSTSFCWFSSWFTSFCAYHLITVTTFALNITPSVFDSRRKTHLFKREGKRFTWRLDLYIYILPEYISDIYVDGLCIISVKLNFEMSSVVTYLLSIDARWRHGLDWL